MHIPGFTLIYRYIYNNKDKYPPTMLPFDAFIAEQAEKRAVGIAANMAQDLAANMAQDLAANMAQDLAAKAEEKKTIEVIANMLQVKLLSLTQIAGIVNKDIAYVEDIKNKLESGALSID